MSYLGFEADMKCFFLTCLALMNSPGGKGVASRTCGNGRGRNRLPV